PLHLQHAARHGARAGEPDHRRRAHRRGERVPLHAHGRARLDAARARADRTARRDRRGVDREDGGREARARAHLLGPGVGARAARTARHRRAAGGRRRRRAQDPRPQCAREPADEAIAREGSEAMKAKPDPKVAEIRRRIDHPIVDADAHQLETVPVLLDYIREVGGSSMPERFLAFLRHQRRTFEMTWEERYDTRTSMPVWWPIPTENTLDRATTQLPGLMYDRMDELGLDFSIVYPGIGLQIVTLPGMADDELRQVCTRAFNRCYVEMYREFSDRLTPVGLVTMNTPQEACETLEDAVRCGIKAVVIAGDVLRPVPRFAREHPELAQWVWYQDCFGIDSPHDYDPFWAKCVELGVAP